MRGTVGHPRHLGRAGLSYEDVCGKGANQIPFAQVDLERATLYSGEDSEMALQVHQTLWPRLEAEPKLRYVYEQIEMPVSGVLQRIERNGVLIDPAVLAAQSQQLGERMMTLEREAHELAGQPFNMGSPKQIGEILFNKLGNCIVGPNDDVMLPNYVRTVLELLEQHPEASVVQPGVEVVDEHGAVTRPVGDLVKRLGIRGE